jgi:hypothetical protein
VAGVLVVRGDAGIGTTALLDHLSRVGESLATNRLGGAEAEANLPFAAIQRLARSAGSVQDSLPRPQREALRVATGPPPDRFLSGLAVHTLLEAPGQPTLEVVAAPCRHGPPGSRPITGDVIGFALRWDGQANGALWISGDTVLFDGVREVADRFDVGTVLLHLGAVRFGVTGPVRSGPVRYTMTAREGIKLLDLLSPETTIPVHYEGWTHFRQNRTAIESEFAAAPERIRRSIRWAPIGGPIGISI